MEQATAFERGGVYTRRQIRERFGGGSRESFVSGPGRVVCLCVTQEMNPEAPAEVLVGDGAGSLRLSRALASSGGAVPVFVRSRVNAWEYRGDWRVRQIVDDPAAVQERAARAGRVDVALVMLMAEQGGPEATAEPAAGG